MSEELIDFGEDKPAREPPPASDEDLADEIALQAQKKNGTAEEKPRDESARDYLKKRMRLLELQIKHYEEDFRLRHQSERAHITSQRLRITMQVLFIITGFVVVAAVAALVWSAVHSASVIIDAFDTPPALAQQGETGRVVAGAVLDELAKLHAATRSRAAKLKLKNDWTGTSRSIFPKPAFRSANSNALCAIIWARTGTSAARWCRPRKAR